MNSHSVTTYVIHLAHDGRPVRTVPRPFTAAAAAAYVDTYNRLGAACGRTAASEAQPAPAARSRSA